MVGRPHFLENGDVDEYCVCNVSGSQDAVLICKTGRPATVGLPARAVGNSCRDR
jgi:hypothetical protein